MIGKMILRRKIYSPSCLLWRGITCRTLRDGRQLPVEKLLRKSLHACSKLQRKSLSDKLLQLSNRRCSRRTPLQLARQDITICKTGPAAKAPATILCVLRAVDVEISGIFSMRLACSHRPVRIFSQMIVRSRH